MKVTFHQLEVFESVARRLSFTRAAEELSLSQPTVSAQVKQLAEEVGMPLFEQLGKSIHLTDAGRELLLASRAVFDAWNRFEMTVSDMHGLKRGLLKIACASTAKYFTPGLLGPFCAKYPDVDVRLEIANRATLVERLRGNLDDLTIMMLPPDDIDVESEALRPNPLVVVAPSGHSLVGQKNIPVKLLARERFVARENGSATRAIADRFFDKHRTKIEVRMELGSNEAIKHAVAAGLGLAVLSQHTLDANPSVDKLAVLDVVGFPIQDTWYLVTPRGKRLSAVAQAFHDFLFEQERGKVATSAAPVSAVA
jgi:LysR family transcriptional regulator, low CO2-responsive transcriptional regulator